MNRLAFAMLALCAACSPADVLARQGSSLRSTDYVQVAVEEQKKKDAERAAKEKKEREERENVQKIVDKGQAHMDLFEYEAAITQFKEGYRLSQDPLLLVKIAEANRLTGDCAEAGVMYKQYLDKKPDAPDKKTVDARIAEAKACETKAGSRIGEVRRLYKEGVTHYDLAEYEKAVAKFKEAYRISEDPAYLFNIAQSYRMAKNCAEAGRFYQRVLGVQADAPNKAKIEQRIEEMKACSK
jgi:tetratricopeptide (TPR) repeat protein